MAEAAVLVRARDERRWIGRVLDAVLAQTVPAEVVVLDSGSTDGTLEEVAARPSVRLLQMAPADFTYGGALNLGFAACEAPLLVALSAHALPVDDRWLERLLAPFADPAVGAVYGRQLPHADLDPFRAEEVRVYWGDAPREDGPQSVRFSNANGALRARLWRRRPFDDTLPANEDAEWARWAATVGHRVVYVPEAAVYHSHREGPVDLYRRKRAQAVVRGAAPESRGESLRRWWGLVSGDLRRVARHPGQWRWAPYSPVLRAAEVLADRVPAR